MRKVILGIVALVMFALLISVWVNPKAKEEEKKINFYALATVVVDIDEDFSVIICEDSNGNLWEFYGGILEWEIGDGCAMVMSDNGTKEIYDDMIFGTKFFRCDLLAEKIPENY